MIKRITNIPGDLALLKLFIETAGGSLATFRYFSSRPYEIISGHLYTILVLDENGNPVGYGHLDPDGEITWLGICVAEQAKGKGYGNLVMEALVNEAGNRGIKEIFLKVDEGNETAVRLYKKFSFEEVEHEPGKYFIMRRILDGR